MGINTSNMMPISYFASHALTAQAWPNSWIAASKETPAA
jgi:hypothetical protein